MNDNATQFLVTKLPNSDLVESQTRADRVLLNRLNHSVTSEPCKVNTVLQPFEGSSLFFVFFSADNQNDRKFDSFNCHSAVCISCKKMACMPLCTYD